MSPEEKTEGSISFKMKTEFKKKISIVNPNVWL